MRLVKNHLQRKRVTVVSDSNLSRYLHFALMLLLSALLFGLGFILGTSDILKWGAVSADRYFDLFDEHAQLQVKTEGMKGENDQLAMDAKIFQRSQDSLQAQLTELEVEIRRLNEELLFYRHLHESDELGEGLRIQSFKLREVPNVPGHYRFSSIVSYFTATRQNSFLEGHYDIFLEFISEATEEAKAVPTKRLRVLPIKKRQRVFKFKLIHTIKGEFVMDVNEIPERLIFQLKPKRGSIGTIERAFNFVDLINPDKSFVDESNL